MRRALTLILLLAAAGFAWAVFSASGPYPPDRSPRFLAPSAAPAGPPAWAAPGVPGSVVVVLLFDGLSPAMVAAQSTPALDRLRREGAWSSHLVPAFPTVSLVNGFTLTTGCWPDRHGIINNRFLDPRHGFYDHGMGADWIEECQPLHEVAEEQGLRTAVLGWYGAFSADRGWLVSEGEAVTGQRPPDADRARWVTRLIARRPEERPRLVLAYFEGPDSAAHYEGLDSDAVAARVRAADEQVGLVMEAIERHGRRAEISLFVLTDHGMRPASRLVNLERILRRKRIRATMLASGTVAFVYLEDGNDRRRALEALRGYDTFDVFEGRHQPVWSRLGDSSRVPDLIVSARPPYFIEDRGSWPRWVRWLALWGPEQGSAGPFLRATHGYPPDTAGMHGVLYAWGASVGRGVELPRIEAVDVHPTLARLLAIEPGHPVDGRVVEELFASGRLPVENLPLTP